MKKKWRPQDKHWSQLQILVYSYLTEVRQPLKLRLLEFAGMPLYAQAAVLLPFSYSVALVFGAPRRSLGANG